MRLQKAKNQKRGPGKAADRKAALSAQQTIPYLVMHPDGVCQLPGGLYTDTIRIRATKIGSFRKKYACTQRKSRRPRCSPRLSASEQLGYFAKKYV